MTQDSKNVLEESITGNTNQKNVSSETEKVKIQKSSDTTRTNEMEIEEKEEPIMEENEVENIEVLGHCIFDNEIKTDKIFSVNRVKKNEQRGNKRELKCTYPGCDRIFPRPDRLKKHIHHHKNQRQFICAMLSCGKSYITAQHLRRHHKVSHTGSKIITGNGNVPCDAPTCNRTFQTKSSMSKHYKFFHLNSKARYTCEKCFTSFFYCAEYYKHMDEEHGIKKITCDKCDLTFTCQTDRTRHMRGHRTWVCNEGECQGLMFDKFTEKRKHDAIVHPTSYFCHHCNFQSQRKKYLEEHMYNKHLNEWDRPLFGCTYRDCYKTFHHERNYVQHYKKKHLNEAPLFDCPLGCPQTFATKQSSQRHVAKVHQKVDGKEKEEPELPFSCDYCPKKFGKEHNVRRHILRMHADCPRPTISNLVNSVYIKPGIVPIAPRQKNPAKKSLPTPRSRLKKQKTKVVPSTSS